MKNEKHLLSLSLPLALALAVPLPCQAQAAAPIVAADAGPRPETATSPNDTIPALVPGELDQLLAPIALYPDSLLSQVLMAATYPIEIVMADRWVKAHPDLRGEALDAALAEQEWDVSVKSLAFFPAVLTMMSEQLEWTTALGDAFARQDQDVMASVQRLRTKAQAAGQLSSTPQQRIVIQHEYIQIEPANPQVIYVPVYNPVVVYGPWWYPAYPPYVLYPRGYYAAGPHVVFTAGFISGAWLFGGFAWGHGYAYVNHHSVFVTHHDRHHHYDRGRDRGHDRERRPHGAVGREAAENHTQWRPDPSHHVQRPLRRLGVSSPIRPMTQGRATINGAAPRLSPLSPKSPGAGRPAPQSARPAVAPIRPAMSKSAPAAHGQTKQVRPFPSYRQPSNVRPQPTVKPMAKPMIKPMAKPMAKPMIKAAPKKTTLQPAQKSPPALKFKSHSAPSPKKKSSHK